MKQMTETYPNGECKDYISVELTLIHYQHKTISLSSKYSIFLIEQLWVYVQKSPQMKKFYFCNNVQKRYDIDMSSLHFPSR